MEKKLFRLGTKIFVSVSNRGKINSLHYFTEEKGLFAIQNAK